MSPPRALAGGALRPPDAQAPFQADARLACGSWSAQITVLHCLAMLALAHGVLLALPDLDRLRELLQRIQEILALGGIALALAASFMFLLAWVASFLRKPVDAQTTRSSLLGRVALGSSFLPVGLTLVAGLGALVPVLAPYVLKAFALAVVTAAFSWCIAIAALILGGDRPSLARARRALLLAGMPWYCLVLYLSTFL